jgi:tryptophanyl-tRNA synthetase
MTCTCGKCKHMWATEMASLSEDIQRRVRDVMNDL